MKIRMNRTVNKKIVLSISGIMFILLLTNADITSIVKSVVLGVLVSVILFGSKKVSELCNMIIKPVYRIFGLGVGLLAGCIFYYNWVNSSMVAMVFNMLKISSTVGLFGIAIIGAILSMPLISLCLSYLVETGLECIRENVKNDILINTHHTLSAKKTFLLYLVQ